MVGVKCARCILFAIGWLFSISGAQGQTPLIYGSTRTDSVARGEVDAFTLSGTADDVLAVTLTDLVRNQKLIFSMHSTVHPRLSRRIEVRSGIQARELAQTRRKSKSASFRGNASLDAGFSSPPRFEFPYKAKSLRGQ